MASILMDSIKRLYEAKRLTKDDIRERVARGTITESDYETITNEAYPRKEKSDDSD